MVMEIGNEKFVLPFPLSILYSHFPISEQLLSGGTKSFGRSAPSG